MTAQPPTPGHRPRVIVHVDLDAFFCSVEELLEPALAGTAFAVGAPAEVRGVISTASYAARRFGIHSAMPTAKALRLCPHLNLLRGHHALYADYSRRVTDILEQEAPVVEPISIDEAFLDVSDDPRPSREVAAHLQQRLLAELGLPASFGVATNMLVAKIATNMGKPRGLVVVPPGGEAAFLAPLPLASLWGVGPKTQARLADLGIRTIGDLAGWPEADLVRRFGAAGRDLALHARGVDYREVTPEQKAKSISKETTFARDVRDPTALRRTLLDLSDQVASTLRGQGLTARTVRIKLRWPPFETHTRQVTLDQPTNLEAEIFAAAAALFDKAWTRGRPVRLLGVGVSGLQAPARQMGLFEAPADSRAARLAGAVDKIRDKFGWDAVRRASSLDDDGKSTSSTDDKRKSAGQ